MKMVNYNHSSKNNKALAAVGNLRNFCKRVDEIE